MSTKVAIYDTTLRDGAQGEGVQMSVGEKLRIAELLDELGLSYIEGGWPGSNPRDAKFFEAAKALSLKNARIAAFGSTRRARLQCGHDPSMQALVAAEVPVVTVFGKTWKFHVERALEIAPDQNLELIEESVTYLKSYADEVIFDAEHFFDGYDDDPDYAKKVLEAAIRGGADWLVLCDTNGGSLTPRIQEVTRQIVDSFRAPIGIHTHNDAELAVANSLAAVTAGATMVQGTMNGVGERCGNANLVSIIPGLQLKMGYPCLSDEQLRELTDVSRTIDEITNRHPWMSQPYVGRSAFAHKGGVHVSAIMKDARTYEHIVPNLVGNETRVLVSDLSGRANILAKAAEMGVELDPDDPRTLKIVDRVKSLEDDGFEFEAAEASFFLLVHEALGERGRYFHLEDVNVNVRFRGGDDHGTPQMSASTSQQRSRGPHRYTHTQPTAKARIGVEVAGVQNEAVAEGHGPVHAMDRALRKVLEEFYPTIRTVELIDYKVRILTQHDGTASVVRVLIQAGDEDGDVWGTVGVSDDIIDASWQALVDALEYKLLKEGVKPGSYQAAI